MALRKGTASITNETNLVAQDITDIKEALSIDTIQAEQIMQNAAIALNTEKRTYPLVDEQKLATIASGAEVNVNADWNAVSGDAQILNKPTVPTVAGSNGQIQFNNTGAFGASSALTFVGGVLQVTGIGTGTNKTLRLLNASAVETFSVQDNGVLTHKSAYSGGAAIQFFNSKFSDNSTGLMLEEGSVKNVWIGSTGSGVKAYYTTLMTSGTAAALNTSDFNFRLQGNGQMMLRTDGVNAFVSTSALFEMVSTTKGFLPPRMTTAQKTAISAPATGLVVYDTTINKLCVFTTAWETITSA